MTGNISGIASLTIVPEDSTIAGEHGTNGLSQGGAQFCSSASGQGAQFFSSASGTEPMNFREFIHLSFQSQLEALRSSQLELEQWIGDNCKERGGTVTIEKKATTLTLPPEGSLPGLSTPSEAGSSLECGSKRGFGSAGWEPMSSNKTPTSRVSFGGSLIQSIGDESSASRRKHSEEEHLERQKKKSEVHATYRKIEGGLGSNFRQLLDDKLGKSFVTEHVNRWMKIQMLPACTTRFAQRINGNYHFSSFVTALILLNAVFMAVDANNYMDRSYSRWHLQMKNTAEVSMSEPPLYLFYVDLSFAIFFTVEVAIRMIADEAEFFIGEFKTWNAIDIVVVVVSWIEVITMVGADSGANASLPPLRLLRLLRMLRSLRVVRALRFFVDLRLVLLSLLHALMPLLWCFATLFMIMFIFAIFFMQFLGGLLDDYHSSLDYHPDHDRTLGLDWGTQLGIRMSTFWDTILMLLSVITGGEDWTIIHKMFMEASLPLAWIWVGYIIVMVLGVLNVIAAVFVEGALSKAKGDRQLTLLEEQDKDRQLAKELIAEFKTIDADGSDEITLEEWEVFCEQPNGQDFLKICNFGVGMGPRDIFRILDLDDSQKIVIEEFVTGLMSIHGAVHKIDVQTVINNNKKLIKKCYEYMEQLNGATSSIQNLLVDGNTRMSAALDDLQQIAHRSLLQVNGTSFNPETISAV